MRKGWYHETTMDGTWRIYFYSPDDHGELDGLTVCSSRGPFKYFAFAQKDAIEYWQTLKRDAQEEIDKIKCIQFPGSPLNKDFLLNEEMVGFINGTTRKKKK